MTRLRNAKAYVIYGIAIRSKYFRLIFLAIVILVYSPINLKLIPIMIIIIKICDKFQCLRLFRL